MKILVISPTFPPMRSGGADFAFQLCERLAADGNKVQVITSTAEAVRTSEDFKTWPIMRSWSWRELGSLLRIARDFRPEVVDLHFAGSIYQHHPMVTFLATLLKRLAGNPRLVLHVEYPAPVISRPRTIAARVLERLLNLYRSGRRVGSGYGTLLRDSDAIILLCEPHGLLLQEHEADVLQKCITIAPPPPVKISTDEHARTGGRAELRIAPNETLLAYYGYVYPNKGLETLIDAMRLVCARRDDVRLVIVGGANEVVLRELGRPDYLRELKERAQGAGIGEKILWTDFFPAESETPSRLLRAADIAVLPFDNGVLMHRSTFGVAASHHLPIVSTRGKDLESVFVEGENVLLAPPQDASALAETVLRLVSDAALQDRLRRGAQRLAEEHFSWDRCFERTVAVFANR